MIKAIALSLIITSTVSTAMAADYAREKRWAEQTVPDLFVGEAIYLEAQQHKFLSLYTKAKTSTSAVIVVHGLGVHPDWGLMNPLRTGLAEAGPPVIPRYLSKCRYWLPTPSLRSISRAFPKPMPVSWPQSPTSNSKATKSWRWYHTAWARA